VGTRRDGVLEAPAGRVGQLEDGRETNLQPPSPRPDQVAVLVTHDQWPLPPMVGSAPADEDTSARTAGCGQAVQELHGAGRRPGQTEVAVKQQSRTDGRQGARAGVGVEPVAQPERPGRPRASSDRSSPIAVRPRACRSRAWRAGPHPTSNTGPSTWSSSARSWAVTGAK
jgi:hypothetical protein